MPGNQRVRIRKDQYVGNQFCLEWRINGIYYDLPIDKYNATNRSFIFAEHEIAKIVKYDGKDMMIITNNQCKNSLIEDQRIIDEIEEYCLKNRI